MRNSNFRFARLARFAPTVAVLMMLPGIPLKAGNISEVQNVPATTMKDQKNADHVLAIFRQISQIPRCSKHEERISAWLIDWAKQRGLSVKTDDRRNVLIAVPASKGYEDRPTVVLQGHMDMVCQKTDDSAHDFAKDPIVLVRDGDWLRADNTTLGADDGIGVALALAVAEETGKSHPPLELLVTTDEEVDMTGAEGIAKDWLTGRKYINIDSEKEGAVTLGAAGGVRSEMALPLAFSPLDQNQAVFSLRIEGLLGGHSGLEIDKDRANANVLIAQALSGDIPFRMISFSGGTAANAITRTAAMVFALSPDRVEALKSGLATFEQVTRKRYPDEKNLAITLTPVEKRPDQAASAMGSAKAVRLILDIPYGVFAWSKEFAKLPETSNNIGIIKTEDNALHVTTYQRSFKLEKLEEITGIIEAAAAKAGASSERRGFSPAWPPNADSDLYKKSLAAYQRLFKAPMQTEILHAGLECGYIAEKYPGMEIISIGPTLENVHTPAERLHVPSLEKISRFMSELLESL